MALTSSVVKRIAVAVLVAFVAALFVVPGSVGSGSLGRVAHIAFVKGQHSGGRATVATATSPPIIEQWSASWSNGNPTVTAATAATIASQYGVIAALPGTFSRYVSVMRQANPQLRLLVYVNGMWADPNNPVTRSYPESWYSHDAGGRRIVWSPWATDLMDPSSGGWRGEVARLCQADLAASGYDGCYVDNLGAGSITHPQDKSGVPIDPATSQPWTVATWMPQLVGLATTVRSTVTGISIVVNGLGGGDRYFAPIGPSSMMDATVSGMVTEQFVRGGGTPVTGFKQPAAWRQDVDMVVADEATGDSVFAVVKLQVPATVAQQQQWHKYAVASFLLATNGNSYFQFIGDSAPSSATTVTAWDQVNPGTPTGAYTQVGNVYVRSFTHGMAVVNPTRTAAIISLGGVYTNLAGVLVSSLTLPPFSGDVLIN